MKLRGRSKRSSDENARLTESESHKTETRASFLCFSFFFFFPYLSFYGAFRGGSIGAFHCLTQQFGMVPVLTFSQSQWKSHFWTQHKHQTAPPRWSPHQNRRENQRKKTKWRKHPSSSSSSSSFLLSLSLSVSFHLCIYKLNNFPKSVLHLFPLHHSFSLYPSLFFVFKFNFLSPPKKVSAVLSLFLPPHPRPTIPIAQLHEPEKKHCTQKEEPKFRDWAVSRPSFAFRSMAEDWDLGALVRSCSSSSSAAAPPENENPLACLASLTFEEDDNDPFGFPTLVEPRNGALDELHELYRPFYPNIDRSLSLASDFAPANGFREPIWPNATVVPHFYRTSSAPAIGALHAPPPPSQPQPQQTVHLQPQGFDRKVLPARPVSSPFLRPAMQAQTTRSRKSGRKNQQRKSVCHVTAENLSADPWAWRKYGQKPIKGSPFPRNYYRCSSSKGCSARKQVERSNTDRNIFIINYTGDHNHPRPTHRNSLAGSTRNKFNTTSSLQKPDPIGQARSAPAAPCSSSTASLSPTTPLTAPIDEDVAHHCALLMSEDLGMDKASERLVGEDEDKDREEEDEDDLLIPNVAAMSEEIFVGFRELRQSPASGDNFSSGPGRADFTRFSSSAAGAGGGP